MSFEEAAALPVNYLTAYHMLFRVACVRPGERVLVHMAAGTGTAGIPAASQVAGIPLLTPLQLMNHNRTVSGVNIGHLWSEMAILSEELRAVLALWDEGRIKPRIDRVYPFAEAAAAHHRILARQNVGKIVLTP